MHQVERVGRVAAVGARVGQRADDVQELHDRAGPAVGQDQRQRVRLGRAHVQEVDVLPVDLGGELRQLVQPRLVRRASRSSCASTRPAPAGSPAARRAPADAGQLVGPAGAAEPVAQVVQVALRHLESVRRQARLAHLVDSRPTTAAPPRSPARPPTAAARPRRPAGSPPARPRASAGRPPSRAGRRRRRGDDGARPGAGAAPGPHHRGGHDRQRADQHHGHRQRPDRRGRDDVGDEGGERDDPGERDGAATRRVRVHVLTVPRPEARCREPGYSTPPPNSVEPGRARLLYCRERPRPSRSPDASSAHVHLPVHSREGHDASWQR